MVGAKVVPNTTFPKGNVTANTSSFPTNTTLAVTYETPEGQSQLYMILTAIFFSFVIVVGLTGNSPIVATIARCREMRTPCNLLIANICAADLGVCLLAAPLRITTTGMSRFAYSRVCRDFFSKIHN